MKRHNLGSGLLLLCFFCFPVAVFAQEDACKGKNDFNTWFACRVEEAVKARITQRNSTKQSEAPSIAANSSSLLDTSSASDLVGVALNLAGLASDSPDQKATSMSATLSAYAFKALTSGRDPLNPTFYNSNRDYRRLFFTVGFEYPEGNVIDPNERAVILGMKYLPYDKRDASDPSNQSRVNGISAAAARAGGAYSRTAKRIQDYLYTVALAGDKIPKTTSLADFAIRDLATGWPSIYSAIGEAELSAIDALIANELDTFTDLKEAAISAAEEVRKAPQISLAYFTKQRQQNRPDEHKVEAIADLGFRRGNFTLNAAYKFIDNKLTKDIQGGTVAIGSQLLLTRDELEGRMPWIFSVAIDGSWMTDLKPVFRGQAKLAIPLFLGIEIPLSVTVANRTELINETDVRGHIGFTFDLARIGQAFRGRLPTGIK